MDSSRRQSLLPSFLYSSSTLTSKTLGGLLDAPTTTTTTTMPKNFNTIPSPSKSLMIPAPSEPGKIEMYSPQFYAACTVGGILSCGLTHMAVTPLDLVKCNMQVSLSDLLSLSITIAFLYSIIGFLLFFC